MFPDTPAGASVCADEEHRLRQALGQPQASALGRADGDRPVLQPGQHFRYTAIRILR